MRKGILFGTIVALSSIGAGAFVKLDDARQRYEVRSRLIQQFERECGRSTGIRAGMNYAFCVQDKVQQLKPFTLL
jgi:hypothetical protein